MCAYVCVSVCNEWWLKAIIMRQGKFLRQIFDRNAHSISGEQFPLSPCLYGGPPFILYIHWYVYMYVCMEREREKETRWWELKSMKKYVERRDREGYKHLYKIIDNKLVIGWWDGRIGEESTNSLHGMASPFILCRERERRGEGKRERDRKKE